MQNKYRKLQFGSKESYLEDQHKKDKPNSFYPPLHCDRCGDLSQGLVSNRFDDKMLCGGCDDFMESMYEDSTNQ